MSDEAGGEDARAGPPPDASPLERAQHVWSIGSYAAIAQRFLPMAGHLVDAAAVASDEDVLDVACGTGNVALTARRRGARVAGLDVTPSMLEAARENAAIAGAEDVEWRQGDAADLPFAEDAFDVTLSCVGHVFAGPPEATARELLRVTRPGGRVAFTSWTPESVVPAMATAVQAYRPPEPDPSPPPFAWGDPDVVAERLGGGVEGLDFETGTVHHYVLSPAHYWADVTEDSGLFIAALSGVDDDDRPDLRRDVIEAVGRYFDDRENAVRMDYRVTVASVA